MSEEQRLVRALALLGRDPHLRAKLIDFCREIERSYAGDTSNNIRDDISGPIVDALHSPHDILTKFLRNGLVFDYYYRSKIARELALAPDTGLDHIFEPQTTKLLLFLAQRANNVLVGGAYAGDHVILLAKSILERGGVVHAFEPDSEQAAMLTHNAAINRLGNVKVNCLGLWENDSSRLRLVGDDSLAHAELVRDPDKGFATMSIDRYGELENLASLDLIQLDMEGSELPALRGAIKYLSQPPGVAPDLVFEVHRTYVDWSRGLGQTEIVRFLRDLGYRIYSIRDFQSNVAMQGAAVELVVPERTYLEGPPHGFNMLAIKDDQPLLQSNLFRLCSDVSPKLLKHKNPALHWPSEWRGRSGLRIAPDGAK